MKPAQRRFHRMCDLRRIILPFCAANKMFRHLAILCKCSENPFLSACLELNPHASLEISPSWLFHLRSCAIFLPSLHPPTLPPRPIEYTSVRHHVRFALSRALVRQDSISASDHRPLSRSDKQVRFSKITNPGTHEAFLGPKDEELGLSTA